MYSSYDVKAWLDFKVGDILFESSQYGQCAVKVLTKPVEEDGQVRFKAHIYDYNGRREQNYTGTIGFSHYAPALYDEPQYLGMFPFPLNRQGGDPMKTIDVNDFISQLDFEAGG